jgi:histidinol-phosphate aminotransferase
LVEKTPGTEHDMPSSRRQFLHLAAGLASTSIPWSSRAVGFETSQGSPADDDGLIRLYSNENAYGPSAKVMAAITSAARSSNRYPRLQYPELIRRIAASHQIGNDPVLLGCGSTEILRMAASAFLRKGTQLMHASPTFEALEHYARAAASEIISIPLNPAFAHDLDRMLAAVTPSTALVYICNPNNPTGSLTPRKDLEAFIAKLPSSTLVIIDEAYHHYAGASAMYASFIDHPIHNEKLIVARTFSKVYGLAGLRLGYAIAAPKVSQEMKKFATEDNINAIATQAVFAALDDAEGLADAVERNANDRQEFFNQAMARALKPIDSHTNFVMMDTQHPAKEVIEHFRKNNILIGRQFPPMDTYIRVSLGWPEEMLAFWSTWDRLPYRKSTTHH